MLVFARAIDVAALLARMATINRDGSGTFLGSPPGFMERLGGNGGPLYDVLKQRGITRKGSGQRAVWTIPKKVMEGHHRWSAS